MRRVLITRPACSSTDMSALESSRGAPLAGRAGGGPTSSCRPPDEREQADEIGLHASYMPFPDYSLEYVDGSHHLENWRSEVMCAVLAHLHTLHGCFSMDFQPPLSSGIHGGGAGLGSGPREGHGSWVGGPAVRLPGRVHGEAAWGELERPGPRCRDADGDGAAAAARRSAGRRRSTPGAG
jgi:hypothetical protein